MGSPHDGQYQSMGAVDHSSPLLSTDPVNTFSSAVASPHPDGALPATAHSLFAEGTDPGSSLTVPMDVTLSSAPQHMDISPADILNSAVPHDRTPPTGQVSAFASPLPDAFSGEPIADLPRPTQASPAATSASSYASLASSPTIPGMNPAYITPSSIASALDSMGLPMSRSRSGSAASPGHFADVAFPSVNSGPPTSSHSSGYSGYHFPSSDFNGTPPTDEEGSPPLGGSHLMAVGDMLKNIVHTADSAARDCSLGQSATAGMKIDQLQKTIALVAELIAATRLVDGSSLPSGSASPPAPTRASPPHLSRPGPNAQYPHQQLGAVGAPETQPPDSAGLDHESRKRCASSMVEDRVIKAMKLEPQDELTLQPLSQSNFSFTSSGVSMPPFPSNPPSAPSSRPASSAGLSMHHHLNLYQPPLLNHLPPTYPPPLNLTSSIPRSAFDLTPPASAGPPSAPLASFGRSPDTWTEQQTAYVQSQQHRHSLSGGVMGSGIDMQNIVMGGAPSYASPPTFPSPPSASVAAIAQHPYAVRTSRSNSISNQQQANPFAFSLPPESAPAEQLADYRQSRPGTAFSRDHSPGGSSVDYDDDRDSDDGEPSQSRSPPDRSGGNRGRMGSVDHGSGYPPSAFSRPSTGHRRPLGSQPSTDNFATTNGHGNEVPHEYRAEVDRVFFEFLNKICSNLDATDAKGEPIHQTLMAKKMQRLDESPDFRPFKFRIQAFTNAFLEELARQGYPEDKIPMKKIRNYLWNSTYISRFNEDGKKAKSKGNHIWNIEAKKAAEGGWLFRPFHRRLAGLPPAVAYIGLRWSWMPRIWDPQASRNNLPVNYTSPSLPTWLSWQDDQLSGIPPPDAQSCDVTAEARYIQDGAEEFLSQTVHINIAPMSNVDANFSTTSSRRPSLVGDSRRVASDSAIQQAPPARPAPLLRTQTTIPPPPVTSQDAQLIQVLTTAAQRVAQEAQSQVVAAGTIPNEPGHELQALAKQQHVLTVTAQAVDATVSAQGNPVSQPSNALAVAAQQVVLQAARQVVADRSAIAAAQISAGLPPSQSSSSQVTVNEVSVATQSAVAQAVEIAGPLSSEVDVLMTATSLLQHQTQALAPVAVPPLQPPLAAALPLPNGTMLGRASFSALSPSVPVPPDAGILPTGLSISSVDMPIYPQRS